jgi:tetratricopeptide (TPR) repeat protein
MSRNKGPLDNVVPFPGKAVPKFGYRRVARRRAALMEHEGQLNLFNAPDTNIAVGFGRKRKAKVVRIPKSVTPFEEALVSDERGDASAVDKYWKAITDGDSVADAYCNLGVIECRRNNVGKAFNSFTNSLEADPRHFEAHYNVANLYFETGDLRLAKLHYEIAAEIRPDNASVYFNLGLVHSLNEDYKAAILALSNYKELATDAQDRRADDLLDNLKRTVTHPE